MKGMCVNKIKLKLPFEDDTFLKLHTMTMGQHFFDNFGGTCC